MTLKQHDTWPPLRAVLSDADGPVDLTGADVKVLLKDKAGPTVISGTCTVPAPLVGEVRYDWVALDTATVRNYDGEFEVTWGDSTITTFPNDGYFIVAIVADLG